MWCGTVTRPCPPQAASMPPRRLTYRTRCRPLPAFGLVTWAPPLAPLSPSLSPTHLRSFQPTYGTHPPTRDRFPFQLPPTHPPLTQIFVIGIKCVIPPWDMYCNLSKPFFRGWLLTNPPTAHPPQTIANVSRELARDGDESHIMQVRKRQTRSQGAGRPRTGVRFASFARSGRESRLPYQGTTRPAGGPCCGRAPTGRCGSRLSGPAYCITGSLSLSSPSIVTYLIKQPQRPCDLRPASAPVHTSGC